MQQKIKITLVDDHELVRTSFKLLLELDNRFEIIGECADEKDYKKSLENMVPDVVIMDIKLNGVSGIELCKYTVHQYPSINVLFASANSDNHHIQLALKSGCKGFVSKNCSSSELNEAIVQIYHGKEYYSKDISEKIIELFAHGQRQGNKNEKLSIREIEIIKLLCEGKDFATIGDELAISPRTVETHKKNILTKLQLNNTIELVKYAIREKIIEE